MAIEDVIVIGSGPAAYTAALYTSKRNTLLFEGEIVGGIGPGGQLTTTTDVDNYPGFPNGTDGVDLMDNIREQALKAGIRIISKNVIKVTKEDELFIVEDAKSVYKSRSVIVGTGASAKRLYVPGTGDDEYWQKGISACAVCDGFAFKNKCVAVVGGGDSAMEEALYLSNIATKVYVIHRRNEFRAREDKLGQLRSKKNIKVLTPYELVSAGGSEVLEYLELVNNENKEKMVLKLNGLFFGIGHVPNSSFLGGLVELENGYIKSNKFMKTNMPGIFVCGDVQDYYYKQAVTAAASGCIAGFECLKYLSEQ